jgi:Co/Zn/Cd efflux system component
VAYPTVVRDAVYILMEGTPVSVDPDEVGRFILENLPGVRRLKGLRIWGITPEYLVLAVCVRTDGVLFHTRDAINPPIRPG